MLYRECNHGSALPLSFLLHRELYKLFLRLMRAVLKMSNLHALRTAAGLALVLTSGQVLALEDLTALGMLESAGLAIVPILGLSLLAVAVFFERWVHCKPSMLSDPALSQKLFNVQGDDITKLVTQGSAARQSVLRQAIRVLIIRRHEGEAAASQAAADVAAHALRSHQQKIYALAVTATVAPIVGLLGTVIGMIDAFHVVSTVGLGDPSALADGIAKALINTAAGLCVALPSLLSYHFFKHRIVSEGLRTEQGLRAVAEAMFAPASR